MGGRGKNCAQVKKGSQINAINIIDDKNLRCIIILISNDVTWKQIYRAESDRYILLGRLFQRNDDHNIKSVKLGDNFLDDGDIYIMMQ